MSDRSRLVVLSLPSALSCEGLRAHFSSLNLPITDIKLLANKAGKSRRVGFIGFRTNGDAQQAKDWYDGTWLAGSRIKVAFAEADARSIIEPEEAPQSNVIDGDDQSQDEAVVLSRTQATSTISHAKRTASEDLDSDSDYLAKRMKRQPGAFPCDPSLVVPNEDDCESGLRPPPASTDRNDSSTSAVSSATQTGRLFLRNLAFDVSREEILDAFSCFGEIEDVHVPHHEGRNKGIAFVQFISLQHAEAARQAMDGKCLSGRLLHVIPSSSRLSDSTSQTGKAETPHSEAFTLRKKSKLLKQADHSFNWAALYMGSDAVVTSLASRYASSKAEFLDAADSSAAARLALAESYIIQETKDYFSSNGVDIAALEPPYSRSRTTLFIKNLPAGSNSVTVRSLLESVKAISRILVPPSGVIALVEFTTPAAATQAVKALAYRKVGNSLIYTERAPTDIWKADTVVEDQKPAKSSAALSEGNDGIAGTPREAGSSSSLYVTGLSLQASAATFKTLFQGFPGFVYAHLHAQSVAGDASRGHQSGFVGFSTPEDAQRARQAMHGHILNGQVLSVVEARSRALDVPPVGKSGSAKMIIKNLPFEVERQDLRKLLSAYGTVQSLRMPVNAQARKRGFAFVQFNTPQEASAARNGLSFTHILGRHLIIEEAQ